MGEQTAIEWTDHTFNPWIGCEKVSQECKHCYAEAYALRWLASEKLWGGARSDRHMTSESNWNKLFTWNKRAEAAGKKEFVFCASLADWAEQRDDLVVPRGKLFDHIHKTPHLIYQLLTKRYQHALLELIRRHMFGTLPENIILGFTTGTNETTRAAWVALDEAKRTFPQSFPPIKLFLSCEPLLENITLELEVLILIHKPDQIIVGGESGPKSRLMKKDWVHAIRRTCEFHDIPFLFKQWGEYDEKMQKVGKHSAGRLLDGKLYNGMPKF